MPDVLNEFRDFFASNTIKKVWHNYGFDRHVENMKLDMRGFRGDTMHMARLYDSARLRTHGGDGYTQLEALGRDLLSDGRAKVSMKTLFTEFSGRSASRARATTRKAIWMS